MKAALKRLSQKAAFKKPLRSKRGVKSGFSKKAVFFLLLIIHKNWPEARPRVAGRRTEGVFEVSQNDSYTWGAKGLPAGSPKGSMQTPLAFPALQTDGACCGRCHRQDADPSEISWCSVSRQNSAGNSNCRSMTLGSVLRREL